MEARPDQEEMEEAIIDSLLLLKNQEKKGFKDFKAWPHIVLVAQACTRFCSLYVLHKVLFALCPWLSRSRQVKDQVIFQRRIKITPT